MLAGRNFVPGSQYFQYLEGHPWLGVVSEHVGNTLRRPHGHGGLLHDYLAALPRLHCVGDHPGGGGGWGRRGISSRRRIHRNRSRRRRKRGTRRKRKRSRRRRRRRKRMWSRSRRKKSRRSRRKR